MRELLGSFLSNDSAFGRAMTHCGVAIGANLMFVLFSLPVITTGAAWTALEYTMLRAERGDGVINPFKEFWKGFRTNWKQSTLAGFLAAALGLFLLVDIRITAQADGAVAMLRVPLTALLIAEVLMLIWLFPVMAAFADRLSRLFTNSFYFALKRAWTLPILLFFHVFPFYLTYTDPQMQPLYAFIWAFFGFSLLARLDAKLMLPVFVPYLPRVDEYGDMILEPEGESAWELPEEAEAAGTTVAPAHAQKSEKEILEEMQKLGM